jgi:hypothetical protein
MNFTFKNDEELYLIYKHKSVPCFLELDAEVHCFPAATFEELI